MIKEKIREHDRDGRETNLRRSLSRAIIVSALSLLLSIVSFGQAPSSIQGSVVDENGGKISGADVRLRSRTGTQLGTSSDANGTFEFRNLPAGQYLIQVQ